jgi:NAD(P)-dependent dehydrogenase (short-subunit alcohol dehydrogenase family)
MAFGFARAGADVVIASRKFETCVAVAEAIEAETGRRALPVRCHVGSWQDVEALVDTVYAEFGRVDVLVNNAGMSPLYDSLDGVSEELYDKVFDVNLKGPFRLTALVGTRMVEAGRGSIIMISSDAAVTPRPRSLPYAAAKAGLNAITVGFAHAFGPAVRVNCIMAGPFATDVAKAWNLEGMEATVASHSALGRVGSPEEVVGAALYFASDASSFTTAAIMPVDGGM